MKIKSVSLLAALCIFTACTSTQPGERQEDLVGFSFDNTKNEVSFTAVSHGCTVKNDFEFIVQDQEIIVKRKRKDECKAMPEAVVFSFSMKEAGINPDKTYTVKNSFIANPNLAGIH